MLLFLFILWVALNGVLAVSSAALEVYIAGALACAAIAVFMVRCMDYKPENDRYLLRNLGLLLACFSILIRDIVLANLSMLKVITRRETQIHPAVVEFTVPLKKRFSRVMLANYITLTPGTITVDQEGDVLTVHCLDRSMLSDYDKSTFVKLLRRMEAHG